MNEFRPLEDNQGNTTIQGDGEPSGNSVAHTINIPDDIIAGYNIIVTVWNLSGQRNSDYQFLSY